MPALVWCRGVRLRAPSGIRDNDDDHDGCTPQQETGESAEGNVGGKKPDTNGCVPQQKTGESADGTKKLDTDGYVPQQETGETRGRKSPRTFKRAL